LNANVGLNLIGTIYIYHMATVTWWIGMHPRT